MEVFVLMGQINYEGDMILGVYASEEEAVNARNVYTRDDTDISYFDRYFVQRRVLGAPAETDFSIQRYF